MAVLPCLSLAFESVFPASLLGNAVPLCIRSALRCVLQIRSLEFFSHPACPQQNYRLLYMSQLPSLFTQFPEALLSSMNSTFWDYAGSGFSYPQLSHRSKYYADVNQSTINLIISHFNVPGDYQVLLLHNGLQYSSIALNILPIFKHGLYLQTDRQSVHAYSEAAKLANQLFTVHMKPTRQEMQVYLQWYTHYSLLKKDTGRIEEELTPLEGETLVCNLNYVSHYRSVDVSKHGIVYFQTGKGLGVVGMCVLIVRKDLIGKHMDITPDLMNFQGNLKVKSILNTPFTLCPYMLRQHLGCIKDYRQRVNSIKAEYEAACREKGVPVNEGTAEGVLSLTLAKGNQHMLEGTGVWLVFLQLTNAGGGRRFAIQMMQMMEISK